MSAWQIQERARPAEQRAARWPRLCLSSLCLSSLCLSSLALAGLTALILSVAVSTLLGQGRPEPVLSAGRGELAAPLLVGLVVATGICERNWPAWLLVPLTIVAMDGANWLAHYADHKLEPLWRFHALHHSQEEQSVLTSFRAHPLMHTTRFILATIPVVVLMPARAIAPVLITIYVCIGTLQHANLRWTFGPAGRVIVSPAYHRLHHAADNQAVNLGVVLTVWDVLAGCARFPCRRDAVGHTGLDGRPMPSRSWPATRHAGSPGRT